MCGISGIFTAARILGDRDRAELREAARRLVHRGPDEQGWIERPHFLAAHNRLAIIGISTGHQPMVDRQTGNVIVFNGEIYNYIELRQELERAGHCFETESDTEVVLKGYSHHGEGILELLNGMFAFGIYDEQRTELFVARDRFGEKPFFFSSVNDTVVFASELSALTAFEQCGRSLNSKALLEYFANGYIAGPASILEGVSQLMPATWMKVGASGISTGTYYKRAQCSSSSVSDEGIADALSDAVKLRLRADVPVATLLSGGIDSSLITLIAQRQSSQRLHSFSFGWEGGDDELPYARDVAATAGTVHHEIRLDRLAFAADVGGVVAHMDMPLADSAAFVVYQLAKVIGQNGVKVVLSGDGGDELFGGYGWYQPKSGVKALLKRVFRGEDALAREYVIGKSAFSVSELDRAFGSNHVGALVEDLAQELRRSGIDIQGRIGFDYQRYLPWMLMPKVDRMSMAHAVEVRAPLLDHMLVDEWSGVPASQKCSETESKIRIKQFCVRSGLLSREFVDRPKMGMNLPLSWWIRTNSDMFRAIVGDSASESVNLFGDGAVRQWFEEVAQERTSGWTRSAQKIWTCYIFEMWNVGLRSAA